MLILLGILLMADPPAVEPVVDPTIVRGEEAAAWLAANYPDCENPRPNDHRPYTLCLSETDFDRAEAEMQREWALTMARVKVRQGLTAARSLQSKQGKWEVRRDRKCQNFAKDTPVTQVGRNYMDCMARMTTERTAYLKGIAR